MRKRVNIHVLLAMFYACSVIASAQGTVARAGSLSKSATITAINHTKRVVTLKDAQGHVEDILCGP